MYCFYILVEKYLILILFYENMTYFLQGYGKGQCDGEQVTASKMFDGQWRFTLYIYYFGLVF